MVEYPLEELKKIKHKRYDQALLNVEKKKELLKQEEEKLKKVEGERDEVLLHKKEKLRQLREDFDKGTTSDKITQKKLYLTVVEEKLREKERKVDTQKKEVEKALKNLEEAKKELFEKKKDVEKLDLHKKAWKKTELVRETREEDKFQDELGSAKFAYKKKK